MGLKVGELRECLGAAVVAALVRLVAGVRADVLLEVRQLCKFALANLTSGLKKREQKCYYNTLLGRNKYICLRQPKLHSLKWDLNLRRKLNTQILYFLLYFSHFSYGLMLDIPFEFNFNIISGLTCRA